MASLIEFAGITGALVVSVVTAFLMARLCFEALFRAIAPARRVASAPASDSSDSDDPPETASRSASRSH